MKKSTVDNAAVSFLLSFIRIILYTIVMVSALTIIGVPMSSIITLIGAAGLAVSLALQSCLSNLAGGFIILFSKPFKSGDMIGKIAETYNVTQDAIISVNNIKQSRLIQVGQYIKIPSMTGILYTVKGDDETPQTLADKYEISAEKCALVNSTKVEKAFTKGSTIFLPDAQLDWATRQEINGDLFRRPLRARYYLSSSYGWRNSPITGNRSFHGGVDMACSTGTPVYAALDGTVTSTGYNATYGNYVIITHHSGYKTLYGHLSAITCKRGNFVYTTTQIGRVGSTGLSTGPHLHFTVYKYNKTVNPLSLIN